MAAAPHVIAPVRRRGRGRPLGERLVSAGLLREDQLVVALDRQQKLADAAGQRSKRLGEIIVEMGLVDEADLLPLLGEQLDVPGVKLREGLIDPEAIALVPREIAESAVALPLLPIRDELVVAMADPRDLAAIDTLENASGRRVRPVFTLKTHIERLIPRCYEDNFAVDSVTADLNVDDIEVESEAIDLDDQSGIAADGSPVINLVNYAIVQAVLQGASDIHIEPGQKRTSIRFRVDGVLREVMKPRREMHPAVVSRIKVMSKLDIAEHRKPQDGRVHVRVQGREVDLRISTLPTVLGEKIVMRVLDRRNITFDLDKLGIAPEPLAGVRSMLARPHGLVLVTGPTGSGKTTTLYSAMELIKGVERNVVTVEDPVEYQLELINQVQVKSENGMTFAGALRSILRQDPDVIMVGEIRDKETAETAIAAALTGHLVLSTLHTNDSAAAITRLIDMGVDRFKIAAALVGVVAQRLTRRICAKCKEPYYPPTELVRSIAGDDFKRVDDKPSFARARGCNACYETGYSGRIGVYEVLTATTTIRGLINDDATLDAIRAARDGASLRAEAMRLAAAGTTTLDEVARIVAGD